MEGEDGAVANGNRGERKKKVCANVPFIALDKGAKPTETLSPFVLSIDPIIKLN